MVAAEEPAGHVHFTSRVDPESFWEKLVCARLAGVEELPYLMHAHAPVFGPHLHPLAIPYKTPL